MRYIFERLILENKINEKKYINVDWDLFMSLIYIFLITTIFYSLFVH